MFVSEDNKIEDLGEIVFPGVFQCAGAESGYYLRYWGSEEEFKQARSEGETDFGWPDWGTPIILNSLEEFYSRFPEFSSTDF